MTQPNTVTVRILDKEYCIACPPEEQFNLENAARYLDGKMREIRNRGKVIGSDRIAVMAALNITHELLQKKQPSERKPDIQQQRQIRDLLERVDQALTDPDA